MNVIFAPTLRQFAPITLVIGMALLGLGCTGLNVEDRSETDDTVSVPIQVTGAQLASYENSRNRCSFESLEKDSYRSKCHVTIIQPNGSELRALGTTPNTRLNWNDPVLLSGQLEGKPDCEVLSQGLEQVCTLVVKSLSVKLQIDLNVKDIARSLEKVVSDELLLPYFVGVAAGLVPSIPFKFVADSKNQTEKTALTGSVQKLGFQNQELDAKNLSLKIQNFCAINDEVFFESGGLIYRLKGNKVTLFAGTRQNKNNAQDYSAVHPLEIRFGHSSRTIKSIQCNEDFIIVHDYLKVTKIFKDGKAEIIAGRQNSNNTLVPIQEGSDFIHTNLGTVTELAYDRVKDELYFFSMGLFYKVDATKKLKAVAGKPWASGSEEVQSSSILDNNEILDADKASFGRITNPKFNNNKLFFEEYHGGVYRIRYLDLESKKIIPIAGSLPNQTPKASALLNRPLSGSRFVGVTMSDDIVVRSSTANLPIISYSLNGELSSQLNMRDFLAPTHSLLKVEILESLDNVIFLEQLSVDKLKNTNLNRLVRIGKNRPSEFLTDQVALDASAPRNADSAFLSGISNLAFNSEGEIYFAFSNSTKSSIMKLDKSNKIKLIHTAASYIIDLKVDYRDDIYFSENGYLRKIDHKTNELLAPAKVGNYFENIYFDKNNALYFDDQSSIRRVNPDGSVTLLYSGYHARMNQSSVDYHTDTYKMLRTVNPEIIDIKDSILYARLGFSIAKFNLASGGPVQPEFISGVPYEPVAGFDDESDYVCYENSEHEIQDTIECEPSLDAQLKHGFVARGENDSFLTFSKNIPTSTSSKSGIYQLVLQDGKYSAKEFFNKNINNENCGSGIEQSQAERDKLSGRIQTSLSKICAGEIRALGTRGMCDHPDPAKRSFYMAFAQDFDGDQNIVKVIKPCDE